MTTENNVFRQLFDFATVGILSIDETGKITMMNPHALNLFGYNENEIIGQRMEVLLPEKFHFSHVALRSSYMEAPNNRLMG